MKLLRNKTYESLCKAAERAESAQNLAKNAICELNIQKKKTQSLQELLNTKKEKNAELEATQQLLKQCKKELNREKDKVARCRSVLKINGIKTDFIETQC